jgi:hypothetical protein
MFAGVLVVICCLLFAPLSAIDADESSSIQLRTFLEQDEVPLNREIVYHVELSWTGELNRYHIFEIGEPAVTNLKLRGSGSSNIFFTDSLGNPRSVKRITYYFIPLSMGMAYVDGVTIQYEDKLLNQKELLSAQRLGAKIVDPLPEDDNGMDLATWIGLLFILLFVFVLVYYLIRYVQQRRMNAAITAEQSLTLEERYEQMLKNSIDLGSDRRQQSLNTLAKLFNSYCTEKFKLEESPSMEVMMSRLENEKVAAETLEKLRDLYRRNELSKFAGEDISVNDVHLYYDTVEVLINHFKSNTAND